MRACAACFWFRRREATREGECMNRPPIVFPVDRGMVNDRREIEFVSVRATVLEDDFCHFFSHPKKVAAQQDAPPRA